jgi:hypothetical protein
MRFSDPLSAGDVLGRAEGGKAQALKVESIFRQGCQESLPVPNAIDCRAAWRTAGEARVGQNSTLVLRHIREPEEISTLVLFLRPPPPPAI